MCPWLAQQHCPDNLHKFAACTPPPPPPHLVLGSQLQHQVHLAELALTDLLHHLPPPSFLAFQLFALHQDRHRAVCSVVLLSGRLVDAWRCRSPLCGLRVQKRTCNAKNTHLNCEHTPPLCGTAGPVQSISRTGTMIVSRTPAPSLVVVLIEQPLSLQMQGTQPCRHSTRRRLRRLPPLHRP